MLGKEKHQNQLDLFRASLQQIINPKHALVLLASIIPWKSIEEQLARLYPKKGAPSHPIRMMTGILLLQRIYNLSDERITALWQENPYFQFFCGKTNFQWNQPCAASDLVHFRKRLGQQGLEILFALSMQLHKHKIEQAREVLVDTTVQEKNITFPTDEKLYKKVIARCNQIAQQAGVSLRQSYCRVVKKLSYAKRYAAKAVRAKEAKRVVRKLRTLAGRQVRDLQRKLAAKSQELATQFSEPLQLMDRMVQQKRNDKNKVYSLHAPEVSCIAKGKAHKKYEFGSKVSVAMLPGSNVLVGIESYTGNPHDSKTLLEALEAAEARCGHSFSRVVVDKGYRGHKVSGKEVILPGDGRYRAGPSRRRYQSSCRRRCGIEAIISHLKHDHRMGLNYLKGRLGDIMNALLSAIGFNLKLLVREIVAGGLYFMLLIFWGPKMEEKLLGRLVFCKPQSQN